MQRLDRFLNWIASRQHGTVTRAQLLEAGFTSRAIELRVASGALIPIHPGVYLVGHRAAAPLAYEAAAILACRPEACLSRATATRRDETSTACAAGEGDVVAALNEARVQRLVSDRELVGALERYPLRTGARALRRLLVAERGPLLTESKAERLAVEVDGFKSHSTPHRFVRDRRRAAFLAARGVLVFPLTWQDSVAPADSMARLRAALARRRAV